MTDKKKLDEAATLNLSHTEGDMTATTTFTADDTVALAAMLKNAGIAGASNHFNGAASLVVDNSEGGMSTTIQAPNLRSIMQLLEPDFATADQEAELDFVDAESDDDHIVDPAPVEEPCVDSACDTEIGFDKPVDATVDADGNLALAGSEELEELPVDEAEYDYREHDAHPHEYAGVADRKPVQPDTKVVPSRSGDNPLEEAPSQNALKALLKHNQTERDKHDPDSDMWHNWDEQVQKVLPHILDEEPMKLKSFSDYVREAESRNVEEEVEVEAEVTMESLLQEYGRGGADSYQRNSRQYGPPFFLNTDCGYASLNDLGTHEYFQHDGVVILAINRSGKWGLNYVAGSDNTKPGTLVTVVTPTSSGQKYREGKVVDSFTMAEYQNDRAGLEARLAQHGISPTKKLSVKTFD